LTSREKSHPAKNLLTALENVKAAAKPVAFYPAFVILNGGVEGSPGCWISSHNVSPTLNLEISAFFFSVIQGMFTTCWLPHVKSRYFRYSITNMWEIKTAVWKA